MGSLAIFPHYMGAILMTIAFVLHVITIGTPSWTSSDKFKPVQYGMKSENNGTLIQTSYYRQIWYGLFRLCTDACLYELAGDYECSERSNLKRKNETSMSVMCYTMVPAPSQLLYGDNGVQSPGWLIAAQAMAITGLIVLPLSAVIVIALIRLICHRNGSKDGSARAYAVILGLSFIVAGIISIIANIIYGIDHARLALWDGDKDYYEELSSDMQNWYDEILELGWGFWLDVAAGIVSIVAGLLHLVGVCTYSDHEDSRRLVSKL